MQILKEWTVTLSRRILHVNLGLTFQLYLNLSKIIKNQKMFSLIVDFCRM